MVSANPEEPGSTADDEDDNFAKAIAAIKGPRVAFFFYLTEKTEGLKGKEANEQFDTLSYVWSKMDEYEKQEYFDMAEADYMRYDEEIEALKNQALFEQTELEVRVLVDYENVEGCIHVQADVQNFPRTHSHSHSHTYTHTHARARAHTHTHTHSHTHTCQHV